MLTRNEALKMLNEHLKDDKLVKHVLAVEAIMRNLAKHLGEDEELWGIVGLIHDLDYQETMNSPGIHATKTVEYLQGLVPPEVINAVKAHNYEYTHVQPQSRLEKGLICSDAVSGLIIAAALVMPDKKLEQVRVETLKKKFKDKTFAAATGRDRIRVCEEIGVPLSEFFRISLEALQKISGDLGF
ncbi:MAG: HDIG domain-containing protein [Candidatus Freyarchaeota archaeon]|nr:HDIG domain-containing protein [Candidatus Jordarchaeia archaeon]MBS7268087.1 HDIG domain-containing protein [Candidatus Jordarchaeia archaeon]MBS7279082.1 HDIG domain-containing protein [Candidatus Jordarchaeia archaeon]